MASCFKEILISEVQSRPVLWQDTNKHFKNKSVTDKLWAEVGSACGMEGNEAKSKWKNLKDQFRRETQKLPVLRSGSKAMTVTSKWKYYTVMQFLQPFVTAAKNEGNLDRVSEQQQSNRNEENHEITDDEVDSRSLHYDESDAEDLENSQSSVIDNLSETPSSRPQSQASTSRPQSQASTSRPQSQASTSRPQSQASTSRLYSTGSVSRISSTSRKRKNNSFNDQYLELQKAKVNLLEKEINNSKDSPESSDLQFFRSLLPYMERLPLLENLELRTTIQQLVLEKFRKVAIEQQPPVPSSQQSQAYQHSEPYQQSHPHQQFQSYQLSRQDPYTSVLGDTTDLHSL